MDNHERLIQAAMIALGACAMVAENDVQAAPKKGGKTVECFGVNSCKGTNGCAVSPEQISVANKVFSKKFPKSKPVDCAGNSDCSMKSGFLAWVAKDNAEQCFGAGGFLLEKDPQGKIVVREKSGTKT